MNMDLLNHVLLNIWKIFALIFGIGLVVSYFACPIEVTQIFFIGLGWSLVGVMFGSIK